MICAAIAQIILYRANSQDIEPVHRPLKPCHDDDDEMRCSDADDGVMIRDPTTTQQITTSQSVQNKN